MLMQATPAVDRAAATGLRVRQLSDLPPLSPVAQRLLAMLTDDRVTTTALAQTIELDPGLTARVVGLARSAFFGYAGAVYTVRDAIVRVLGLETVRSLALSLALSSQLRAGPVGGFDLPRYWGNALLTAYGARALAPRVGAAPQPSADSAYLCGLLHNLGLQAMVSVFADEMKEVFALAGAGSADDLQSAEHQVLGVDHHQVGGWLADRWHLPPEVAVVMEHHREPQYGGAYWTHARLVGVCNRLAEARMAGEPLEASEVTPSLQELRIPGQSLEEVQGLVDARLEPIRELAASLAQPG